LKTEERRHIRIKELMGIKKPLLSEAPTPDLFGTKPSSELADQGLQAIVGAETSVATGRAMMGNTPISQGYINRVVLEYLDGTGPFGLTYSFAKDVVEGDTVYKSSEIFSTKTAEYFGETSGGNAIIVDTPDSTDVKTKDKEEDIDKKEEDNRNKRLVQIFKRIGIKFDVKDPFVVYFRKGIRPILRRLKTEFPEYNIEFLDQGTNSKEENVIIDSFLTTKSILFEEYKESMRQLMDLHKGKKEYSKDKKMVDILDGEIEKEKKKLLKIIKPRFKKVFLKYFTSLDDNQILKLGMYLSTFLSGLKEDYPQYRINYGQMKVTEVEEKTTTPKKLSIILEQGVKEVWIDRRYPCKVKVGEGEETTNTIKILDVISQFVFKGGTTSKKGGGGGEGNTCPDGQVWNPVTNKCEEKEGSYEFPSGLTNRQDKGKRFWVTMEITTSPANYLKLGYETDILQPHNPFVYVVEMLFNGFELERINSSSFPNQNFEGKQVRFIFPDDIKGVTFGKEYQVEVKKENESLGYLNIIVTDIVKR
tara:strand:+ start:1187 stop:2782 length:1596 start_codon:yes stop_codon:yes gene_type:complete